MNYIAEDLPFCEKVILFGREYLVHIFKWHYIFLDSLGHTIIYITPSTGSSLNEMFYLNTFLSK